jgi:hypothetical protein
MIGQHLRVRKDGRWIHAIDCGDETVLHLGDDSPRRVRRAYRPEFVAGAEAVEPVLHRERTFAPKEIVRRAYSRAADPTLAAMFADSEAFAEWCATGRLPGPRNVVLEPVPAAPAAAQPAPKPAPKPAKKAAAKARPAVKAKPAARAKAKARPKAKAKPAAKAKATARAAKPAKRAAAKPARKPAPKRKPAKRGKR